MIPDPVKWLIAFLAALVLQTSFVPAISLGNATPDLLLIVLFFFSLKYGVMPGIFVGFFLGLGQDLYSPSLLGQNALVKTLTGAFIGLFNERVMRTDPLVKTVLLIVVFIVHDALFMAVQVLKLHDSLGSLFSGLFFRTLPRALYSVAVAALFYLWEMIPKPSVRK
ncbi:MAG TPA: rod shape-determining protein MreD [Chitinivibrionales bacterium]|nr:rod shape-determining protein MreD [Chitinivibrionales bacterium]